MCGLGVQVSEELEAESGAQSGERMVDTRLGVMD